MEITSEQNSASPKATHNVINDICPWSGKPVSADSLTSYKGHIVGFCNTGCRNKFEAATTLFDQAIEAIERS